MSGFSAVYNKSSQSDTRDFSQTGGVKPPLTRFNINQPYRVAGDMMELYPCFRMDCIPGDKIDLNVEFMLRMAPMPFPTWHEFNLRYNYFFVPYRILWDAWELFWTGGRTGDEVVPVPKWLASDMEAFGLDFVPAEDVGFLIAKGRDLWDFMGFPVERGSKDPVTGLRRRIACGQFSPNKFGMLAYYMIYYYYYLDKDLVDTNLFDVNDIDSWLDLWRNNVAPANVLRTSWAKDRFTTSRPWQQRGTGVAIPLSGHLDVISNYKDDEGNDVVYTNSLTTNNVTGARYPFSIVNIGDESAWYAGYEAYQIELDADATGLGSSNNALTGPLSAYVDLAAGVGADIAEMRVMVALQRKLELSARTGFMPKQVLIAHYGVAPRDERLQMPEWISGGKEFIQVSEMPQTAPDSDGDGVGNIAGKGFQLGKKSIGHVDVQEHGIIIGLVSVSPVTEYHSQGVKPMDRFDSNLDLYWVHFAHISEQPMPVAELFISETAPGTADDAANAANFGFVPYGDQWRAGYGEVVGDMRDIWDFTFASRIFEEAPRLNIQFRYAPPRKDYLAVQDEDAFKMYFYTNANCLRPLPYQSEPGLMDHSYGSGMGF